MSRLEDEVDIELPFFRLHVGGGSRFSFGEPDEGKDDVIDMERAPSDEYAMVRREVRKRLRFLRHLVTFLAFNGLFVLLDWSTGGSGSGLNWSQWVALIWGIFLAWEFISTFVSPVLWGREMEERLIERELRRRRGA
jgi:hypothetical protein